MADPATPTPPEQVGLRERKAASASTGKTREEALVEKVQTSEAGKLDSEKKTFGRTPDGTSKFAHAVSLPLSLSLSAIAIEDESL